MRENINKLRIASYYHVINRNDGAPLYVTNVVNKMKDVDIVHLNPHGDISKFGKFDAHLWVDWGEDAVAPMLGYEPFKCPKPNIYWVSDTHLGYEYRLKKAREFDKVFCMQKRAVEEFKRDGIKNVEWLPHAAEPQAYMPFCIVKKYDVCFVGHLCNEKRVNFLDAVFKKFPNFWYGQRIFEEAARIFCQSKIVLNTAAVDDLNMRVFETLATQSFLLTENIPTIHEVFKDGEHLVTYDSIDDAIDKADYYIKHDDERQQIAESGYNYIIKNHTYRHRVDRIIQEIKTWEGKLCLKY